MIAETNRTTFNRKHSALMLILLAWIGMIQAGNTGIQPLGFFSWLVQAEFAEEMEKYSSEETEEEQDPIVESYFHSSRKSHRSLAKSPRFFRLKSLDHFKKRSPSTAIRLTFLISIPLRC